MPGPFRFRKCFTNQNEFHFKTGTDQWCLEPKNGTFATGKGIQLVNFNEVPLSRSLTSFQHMVESMINM